LNTSRNLQVPFLHQLGGRYILNIFLTWNSCSLLRKKVKQNARPQFRLRDTRIKLKVVVVSRRRKVKENLFLSQKTFKQFLFKWKLLMLALWILDGNVPPLKFYVYSANPSARVDSNNCSRSHDTSPCDLKLALHRIPL